MKAQKIFLTGMTTLLLLTPWTSIAVQAESTENDGIQNAFTSYGVEFLPQTVQNQLAFLWQRSDSIMLRTQEELQTRLTSSLFTWEVVGPDWSNIPVDLMNEVRLCRQNLLGTFLSSPTTSLGGIPPRTTDKCGDELRRRLQYRHAEQFTARITERIQQVENLPEPRRSSTLALLEMLHQRIRERLREMDRLSDDEIQNSLGLIGEGRTELDQLHIRFEEKSQKLTPNSTTPQTENSKNQLQGSAP